MSKTVSRELPACAARPWGTRGDAYCWTAALADRHGAVKTWYCNSRAVAEDRIMHHCAGAFGNTGVLANADDASIAPITYTWNTDLMKAAPIGAATNPAPVSNDGPRATSEPATMTYAELRSQYPYLSDAPEDALDAYRAAERARTTHDQEEEPPMTRHRETVRELRYGMRIVAEHDYTGCVDLFTRADNGALTPLGVVRKVAGYRPGIVHYHTCGERFDSLAEAADYLLDEANERDMAEWEAAHPDARAARMQEETLTCPHCGETVTQWLHDTCCACHDAHCACGFPMGSYGITPERHPHLFPRLKATLAAAALLALALTGQHASAHPDYRAQVTARVPVPVGCTLTRAFEDLTAEAVCAGGYLVWLNAQPDAKALDIPYAVGSYQVGPDANGRMWEYAILD